MKQAGRDLASHCVPLLAAGLMAACRTDSAPPREATLEPRHANQAPIASSANVVLACSGRVEGLNESVGVAAGIDGVISEIRVEEGQQVQAGQILALLDRRELAAELSEVRSELGRARANRQRLLRGSRIEARARAEAETIAARAAAERARARYGRLAELYEQQIIAADLRDEGQRDLMATRAALEAAQRSEALVKAEPLPEEIARADAEVGIAEARVRRVSERMRKCEVKAPFRGTVLRTHLKEGEAYSTFNPQPIVTIADTSRFRVRAQVDERDLQKTYLGQKVTIRGEGLGEVSVDGVVAFVSSQMGRKTIMSGDPAEKSDRDVLEVLIDLGHTPASIVVGLRVTVLFLGDHEASGRGEQGWTR